MLHEDCRGIKYMREYPDKFLESNTENYWMELITYKYTTSLCKGQRSCCDGLLIYISGSVVACRHT